MPTPSLTLNSECQQFGFNNINAGPPAFTGFSGGKDVYGNCGGAPSGSGELAFAVVASGKATAGPENSKGATSASDGEFENSSDLIAEIAPTANFVQLISGFIHSEHEAKLKEVEKRSGKVVTDKLGCQNQVTMRS